MQYEINGTVMQTLDIKLNTGESIYTESGGMAWMQGDVEMSTNAKGGFMAGIGRALSGESLFITTYTSHSEDNLVVFTPESPGKVVDVCLEPGQCMICQKDAFMCAEESVKLEVHFNKKLGAGLFGGEGFILQKTTGPGHVFFEIAGEVREYTLGEGEEMKIDPGHIALFDSTVTYDIARVKGFSNIFFSGEGLFLATLRGPGKIWLQSLPLANLAGKLSRYLPKSNN